MKNKFCVLCGGSTEVIDSAAPEVYYHCKNCQLIFLDKKYYLGAQEEQARYKMHENTLDNSGYVKFLNKFINDAGIDKLDGVKHALDFGCGPGPVLSVLLSRLGMDVDIYDPYFYPKKVFRGKQYDLITCTEVLEHIQNPLAILTLLESLLKENGVLAVMTMFHTTTEDFSKWWYRKDPTHIRFYCPQTFEWIQDSFNFTIELINNHNICVLRRN